MQPVFDAATRRFMDEASSDFGWRALYYENSGDAQDPYPTGLVAIEAFLFKRVPYTHTSKAGRRVKAFRAEDEDDIEAYAARVRTLLERAPTLVAEDVRRRAEPPPTAPTRQVSNDLHDDVRQQMTTNAAMDEDSPPKQAATTTEPSGGGDGDHTMLD